MTTFPRRTFLRRPAQTHGAARNRDEAILRDGQDPSLAFSNGSTDRGINAARPVAVERHAAQCGVRLISSVTNLIRLGQKLKLLTQRRLQNRKGVHATQM